MKKKTLKLVSMMLSLSMVMSSFALPAYATQVDAYEIQDEIVMDDVVVSDETVLEESLIDKSAANENATVETVEDSIVEDSVVEEIAEETDDAAKEESAITEENNLVEESGFEEEADSEDDILAGEVEEEIEVEQEVSEEAQAYIITADDVTLRFSNTNHVTIPGIDSNNEIKVPVDGNGINLHIDIEEGCDFFDGVTDAKDINGAYIYADYLSNPGSENNFHIDVHTAYTPEENVINIDLVVLPAVNVSFEFEEGIIDPGATALTYCYEGNVNVTDWSRLREEFMYSNKYVLSVPKGIDTYTDLLLSASPIENIDFYYKDTNEKVSLKANKKLGKLSPCINLSEEVTISVKKASEETHSISSASGDYLIKTGDSDWNSYLSAEINEKEAFEFIVKPNPGFTIEKVLYNVKHVQAEMKSSGGNNSDGFTYVIPAGIKNNVLVAVITKPIYVDFNRVTVALYFNNASKASTTTPFNKKAADSPNGIVPTGIEVRDASGKVVDSSVYEVVYNNNRESGTAFVEIIPKSEYAACFGSKKVPFTIVGTSMADTKKIKIEVPSSVVWDNEVGINNVPNVVVTDISDPKNNFTLGIYSDFEPAFTVPTTPGTYSITVIGLGGYYGSRTVKYNVVKPSFANATEDGANGSIKIETIAAQDYTAKAIKPVPVITYNGIELVEGVDYTIKGYANNINAYELSEGDEGFNAKKAPSITIAGKGNYQGTKKVYFKINKVSLVDSAVKITVPSYKYTGKEIKAKPVITMVDETGKVVKTFKENTDYTLEYFENVEASSEALVKIVSTANGNLGGEKDPFKFTIANNNIADKKISIKMADNAESEPVAAYATNYTGNAITPYVYIEKKLADGQIKELKKDTDYTVTYENNVNAGKGKVIITGCGEYYGKVTKTFTINKRTVHAEDAFAMNIYLDGKNISVLPHYKYTGNAIKPAVKVVDPNFNDYELKEGVDYTVSFANNTNVSLSTKSPTVTIKFKGNYAGVKAEKTNTISGYFAIDSWDLSDENTTINVKGADKIVYTGKAIKPVVEVINPDGNVVNPKVLKYAYKNNVNARNKDEVEGAPAVVITPVNRNNITAPEVDANIYQVEKRFTIYKANLNDVIQKIKIAEQTYKGYAVTPKITLKFAGKTLKENEDYTVEYFQNTSRGIGTIQIDVMPGNENFMIKDSYGDLHASLEFVIK